MMNRVRCASIVLAILGVGFLVAGVLLIALGDSVVEKMIKKECQLKEGSLLYKSWSDPPVPLYTSIYVFDLQNPVEFLNGAKPRLIQRGPFVYKEERTKSEIRVYENETISYKEPRKYIFDRSRSSDDDTLNFTTINVVYMTLVNYLQMEKTPNVYRHIIGEFLAVKEKPLMTRSVKEYLWGYQDPLLHDLKTVLPQLVSDDRVAVMGSGVEPIAFDTFLINNGVGNDENGRPRVDLVGTMERFNHSTNLTIWSNEYANMINGTDSTIWHPDAKKDEKVYSFIRDICRSLHLTFNETRTNPFDIDIYRYTLPETIFANTSDNQGFCLNNTGVNKTHELNCLPSGLFTLSPCQHLSGSAMDIPLPVIASNPHFLHADRSVLDAIEGLNPNDAEHRSYVDIEPRTGIVMNGSRRLQFNMNVVNDSSISLVSQIRPVVYPMMWGNEHAEIDQVNANIFRKSVMVPVLVLSIIKYTLLGIGIALFIAMFTVIAVDRYRKSTSGAVFPPPATDETSPLLC